MAAQTVEIVQITKSGLKQLCRLMYMQGYKDRSLVAAGLPGINGVTDPTSWFEDAWATAELNLLTEGE